VSGLVVAADGGNSKTDLVLASLEGVVLARVSGAGTRAYLVGVPATANALAELARAAVSAAGLPADTAVDVGSFYLANVDVPAEETEMLAALATRGVAARLEVRNDTFAVLQAGSPRGWGIAVVAGAGINAAGRHPDGREERFLGIGAFSGDWGGGWAVAVEAIGATVRAEDGRGPATALRELVVEAFGAEPDAVAMAANRGEINDAQVFAFAPLVFGAATAGDRVAVDIVHRLADEVIDFVRALLVRMQIGAGEVDVVLGGGTLQSGNQVLLERIATRLETLAPGATLRMLDVAPVTGALVSALTIAGASPDAVRRAREAMR
jgi:N-acetylglucosamine kinase-like BadF-type ATPase